MIVNHLIKGMPPIKFKDHVYRMRIVSSLKLYIYIQFVKFLCIQLFSHFHV